MRSLGRAWSCLVALAILAPSVAFACSGPGAMDAIEAAERRGWMMFGITAGIVALCALGAVVKKHRGAALLMLAITMPLHPAIWLGARHGDCGHLLRDGSMLYVFIAPQICALIYWLAVRRARRAADPQRL